MNISVIGAGTMGNGIAHVFAQSGYEVHLVDLDSKRLDRAIQIINKNLDRQVAKDRITDQEKEAALNRITTFTDTSVAVENADLVVEAATENLDLKKKIFKNLDEHTSADCILATNTSSISITEMAAVTSKPDRVIGMHFMNPVPIMKLVEVIRGYSTSDDTTSQVLQLCDALGKIPVEVHDYPGFIANRILMPMINEAIYALFEGVAGVSQIDAIMKLGMAHPMGPLQLADFIGLDVCLAILKVLQDGFGHPKYAPCPLLVNMVAAGKLGRKSGEGFYSYTKGSKDLVVAPGFNR